MGGKIPVSQGWWPWRGTGPSLRSTGLGAMAKAQAGVAMGGLGDGSRICFFQGPHRDGTSFAGAAGDDSGHQQEANGCP